MKYLIVFALLVIAANASQVTRTLVEGVDGSTLINDITPGFLTPSGLPVGPTSTTLKTLPYIPYFNHPVLRTAYSPYYAHPYAPYLHNYNYFY